MKTRPLNQEIMVLLLMRLRLRMLVLMERRQKKNNKNQQPWLLMQPTANSSLNSTQVY